MATRSEQSIESEIVYLVERGVFNCLGAAPRSAPMNVLGLVEAGDRFDQSIVVAVADNETDGSIPPSARR